MELDKPAAIEGLRYLPRPANSNSHNGTLFGAKLQYSEDGKTWKDAASVTWPSPEDAGYTRDWKAVQLAKPVTAKYFRLQATDTYADGGRNNESLKLRYDESASKAGDNAKDVWSKRTLPIGNGDMGANVYGEVQTEHLPFNEKTLWTGGPSASRKNYNGGNNVEKGANGATVKRIQQLFAEGKNAEASRMCDQLIGDKDGYGAYQAWGDIYLKHTDLSDSSARGYERSLDLMNGIAAVEFDAGDLPFEAAGRRRRCQRISDHHDRRGEGQPAQIRLRAQGRGERWKRQGARRQARRHRCRRPDLLRLRRDGLQERLPRLPHG